MSKTNGKLNDATTGELTEDELALVSGGNSNYGRIEWTYTKQKPA